MLGPGPFPVARGSEGYSPPPALCSQTSRTRASGADAPLKRISLELSRICNLRCLYCYAESGPDVKSGLSDEEVRAVIREAVSCGAALVSFVVGGEPLLRPSLLQDGESCLDFANSLGCYCLLYTNCTRMDDQAARWLYRRDVSVVGKLNSLEYEVQDHLAGVPGAATRIKRGIEALLRAGFAAGTPSRLALETIICRQNYEEMPTLWRWMRERNIVPEVEIPTVHGRFEKNRESLYFSNEEAPQKYKEIFAELLAIDRTEYGFDWIPHPPLPASSCRLYYSNCYINDHGGVQPCAGVDRDYGQLRLNGGQHGRPLLDIIRSEEFQQLRNVHEHLKAPCAGCDLAPDCYGCRGAAWHACGDVFAGDPVCWRRS